MKRLWSGEVLRVGAGALAGDGLPAARTPGEVITEVLDQTAREAMVAGVAARSAVLLQDGEVKVGLDQIGRIEGTLMRSRLRLACEVAERGLHLGSGFGLVDWLGLRCPELDARPLRDLAKLATAHRDSVHRPIVEAVLSGSMTLARGAGVLRALQRIRPGLDADLYAAAVGALLGLAADPDTDDRAIGAAISELLRRCLAEKTHDDANKARRALRDVHESNLADGSVKRLIITFGEDADYEAVRAVLQSPLAAPATKEETDATGQLDERTPGARRYDAFMTVFKRGVAGTKGQPTTAKALLAVTLDFQVLMRLLSESGGLPGCGSTLDGAAVTADSIRRLACEADIIPMVLGTQGEILDQGRRYRTVTPAQRISLAKRDQCCTIPGCTVPATWCEAHHVLWWSRGGTSDILNYALLCPRHHTWVHDNDLTATVTAHGVTWHLR